MMINMFTNERENQIQEKFNQGCFAYFEDPSSSFEDFTDEFEDPDVEKILKDLKNREIRVTEQEYVFEFENNKERNFALLIHSELRSFKDNEFELLRKLLITEEMIRSSTLGKLWDREHR